MPTPTFWTINAGKDVGSGPDRLDLVGCHIAVITDANNNQQYAFETPDNTIVSQTTTGTATAPPAVPCQFPMFNSALSQGAGPVPQDWYITLCSVTAGKRHNKAKGTYSNTGYVECESATEEPPDTWVAQAGTSSEEEEEASAASA